MSATKALKAVAPALNVLAAAVPLNRFTANVLTSQHDMFEAAGRIPHAEVEVLPGSHFLPLEFPDELVAHLRALIARTDLAPAA